MNARVIAVDGVAASGKSTIARRLADELGWPYVSSGLLYRVAGLMAAERGIDAGDEAALVAALEGAAVELRAEAGRSNQVMVRGADVTGRLHTHEVDTRVSRVSRHPGVRRWVLERMRAMPRPLVAEGRDMGRVVFPGAEQKFFLTASAEVRASRRAGERGGSYEDILAALRERDEGDSPQSERAPGAIVIDTSELAPEQVLAEILGHLRTVG